jgi:SAM-dependent methyltransferase
MMTKPTGIRQAVARLLHLQTTEEKWDVRWTTDHFSWLGKLDELAHYSVLAGYALQLKPGGAMLDLGCGDGLLRDRLHPAAFSRYLGVDFNEAIARAQSRVDERTAFVVGDLTTYQPESVFDTIVFNESLYYAADGAAELERYARWLAPDGVFLISTHLKPKTEQTWDAIGQRFPILDRVVVTNGAGVQWICGAVGLAQARPPN